MALYFPSDELLGSHPNIPTAADFLELQAFLAADCMAYTSQLINDAEIAAETDYEDVDEEMQRREALVAAAVLEVEDRIKLLAEAYPFRLDSEGDTLQFIEENLNLGRAAYLLSLILSHLRSISPVLQDFHPDDENVADLRKFFQYFATAGMAAELNGRAWSFGHPRPDQSGFHLKLHEIWAVLKDGKTGIATGAPTSPQDDQIDVLAARQHPDGFAGFLLAAAQVATGKNWASKSIMHHVRHVFPKRWFTEAPSTEMIGYHIIPFARSRDEICDDVRCYGNILHRTRLPRRVLEAEKLKASGHEIEAYELLTQARDWLIQYRAANQ